MLTRAVAGASAALAAATTRNGSATTRPLAVVPLSAQWPVPGVAWAASSRAPWTPSAAGCADRPVCGCGGARWASSSSSSSSSSTSTSTSARHGPAVSGAVPRMLGAATPARALSSSSASSGDPRDDPRLRGAHPACNVPPDVADKVGRQLHMRPNHPLNIIKGIIERHFADPANVTQAPFKALDGLSPIVSFDQNFTDLLIPSDHVSTRPSDTFYLDDSTVLRCHTSAHQCELMKSGETAFLCTGDVYRRDAVDASHYPIFHQMEGVKIYEDGVIPADASREEAVAHVVKDLKSDLYGMVRAIFGDVEVRWVEAYFPFTDPSLELEIYFQDEWLEVLGCGMIHRDLMANCGLGDKHGYAFGLGLERLAMVLFDIPDIRLFWTDDARFHDQFSSGEIVKFQPYSKFPACYKDIAFWLTPEFHENDFYALVRTVAGDLVENVELVDEFAHPQSGKVSHCYRINYRSMDRSLTNAEIDVLQEEVRARAGAASSAGGLGLELR